METEIQSDLLVPFLNRADAFDPAGWFHLVPKGVFPIVRKEGDQKKVYLQVVDDVAIDKMDAAFKNRRSANPEYRMLIDFEHFSHDTGKSSVAACWVTDTKKESDGLWFKGEWSDQGEAAIKNRRYRYLSPVWFPRQTEKLGGNRVRPIEVNDAGLTNKPNLGEALQPFWNRADDFNGREATTNETTHMNKLIALLGLAATATEDDIVIKVQAYKNRVAELEPLQGRLDTLTTEHGALKNRHSTLLEASVTRTMDEYKGVITEESKDAWKNRLTADFDGTVGLLKGLKPAGKSQQRQPVHTPGKGAADAARKQPGEEEPNAEQAFMNRVSEVMTAEKKSQAEAIGAVAEREPDLYEAYNESILSR